jgi:hypothetical protein
MPYQSGIEKYYTILILDTRYSSSSDLHRYLNICNTFAASQQPCFSFNVQVNTCQHSMADHVQSASSMGALWIPELLYIPADIKVHKKYVDAIAYTFNIF